MHAPAVWYLSINTNIIKTVYIIVEQKLVRFTRIIIAGSIINISIEI